MDLNEPTTPAIGARVFEIRPAAQKLHWTMYLIWANGIVFFGAWGAFAFFHTLLGDPPRDNLWTFAGSMCAGLVALAALVFHITRGTAAPVLTINEGDVTISYGAHAFNFGMLEHILWSQDYNEVKGIAALRRRSMTLVVSYREGAHFELGKARAFTVRAFSSPRRMAEVQAWYKTLMLIVKSRQKFQRDNQGAMDELRASGNIAGLADLVRRLNSSEVVGEANIAASDDPRDVIPMLYSSKPGSKSDQAVQAAIDIMGSAPVTVVTNIWFGFLGVVISLVNLGVLYVFVTA